MILHWLNVHLWGPMWPNIFAPSAITLGAITVAHLRARWQADRHHAERAAQADAHHEALKAHVSAELGRGGGM